MILKAPRRTIAAQIKISGANRFTVQNAKARRLKKSASLSVIETPEGLQRTRRSVIYPDSLWGQNPMDFVRQFSRIGEEVEQKRGHYAADRLCGKRGFERIHCCQLNTTGAGCASPPLQDKTSRL